MTSTIRHLSTALVLVASCPLLVMSAEPTKAAPRTIAIDEARDRARLLHEMVHATLHYVHHEYYREDEGLTIPAETLKRMFREVAERQKVELRWLAVQGEAMNVDHKPRDEFERKAAAAIDEGKEEFEQLDQGVYRRAAPVALTAECIKCHVPNRKSTEVRFAGLIVRIRNVAPAAAE